MKVSKRASYCTVVFSLFVPSIVMAQPIYPPLLVAGAGSGSILRYDSETGAFIDAFVGPGVGGLCQGQYIGPHGMVFGPDGNVYVTCHYEGVPDFGVVLRYDGRSGEPLPGPLGTPGTAQFVHDDTGRLISPFGLEFGPDGNLYVCSGGDGGVPSPGDADRVLRYDGQTGAYIDEFVTTSSGGLDGPYALVFGPHDGHLYVTSLHTDEVLRYDGTTGAFMNIFASGDPLGVPMDEPFELRFGPDGNLYVTSWGSQNVARFDGQTGVPIDNFIRGGGTSSVPRPTGLRFGPDDGNLYVASHYGDRVMRYDGQTGALIDTFVTTASGGLDAPVGLAFFPTPPCETGSGQDCNHNGIDDTCEILEETSQDLNGNGIPDECDPAPTPPLPDPDGPGAMACSGGDNYGLPCTTCSGGARDGQLCLDSGDCSGMPCDANDALCPGGRCGSTVAGTVTTFAYPKSRYIGFSPNVDGTWVGQEVAIRIKMESVPGFPDCEGEVRYAGAPEQFCEGGACTTMFWASQLQNTPHWMDWTTVGTVQLFGEEIIADARFIIQAVDISASADLTNEANFSILGLVVDTAKWGDVIPPLAGFTAASQPQIADVLKLVDKWLGNIEPRKSRSQLQPQVIDPNQNIGIADILKDVDAWLGTPYPFSISTCTP